MRYIEDIQQIHIDLTRDDGDILVVCSLLDKLCFLMVDWARQSLYFKDIQVNIEFYLQIKTNLNSILSSFILD